MRRFVLAFVALAPATAFAGETAPRDFDDRHGWMWELGVGPWGGVASDSKTQTWTLGGAIDLGVHHVTQRAASHHS